MNRRKLAYLQGLSNLKKNNVARRSRTICAISPSLYNREGMISPNQIVEGESIELLNKGPEGWVDLCFVNDAKRSSKVKTETDAFGRPRVARRKAAKSA